MIRWYTGFLSAPTPAAASGASSIEVSRRKSRTPLSLTPGSNMSGSSNPATTRGSVCGLRRVRPSCCAGPVAYR